MKDEDFINTDFISKELRWVFKEDFFKFAKLIKIEYSKLNRHQREIYKWYCYANIHTTMHQKNKIWEYLNGDIDIIRLYDALKSEKERYTEK